MTDLPPEEIVDFPLEIGLNITTLYSDYNLPVEITLPEGQDLRFVDGFVPVKLFVVLLCVLFKDFYTTIGGVRPSGLLPRLKPTCCR